MDVEKPADEVLRNETETQDVRVGWIYKLRKQELESELVKFGLVPSNTVEEMRKQLVTFLREGNDFKTDNENTVPTPRPVPTTAQTTYEPLNVFGWNLRFSGNSDPAAFLERLEEIRLHFNIAAERLLPVLPQILEGSALLWCRNNRSSWQSWSNFIADFKRFYYPANYFIDIEAEISRRLHRLGEPVFDYINEMQTLIRRHGSIDKRQELAWLQRNLRPEFRQMLWNVDIPDIGTFIEKAKAVEAMLRELKSGDRADTNNFNPPPQRSINDWERQARETVRAPTPPPNLSRPKPAKQVRFTTNNAAPIVCWRCGQTGHMRSQCRAAPRLFCSRCGKQGVLSRDCRCPEN